jgi:hypothetical protein
MVAVDTAAMLVGSNIYHHTSKMIPFVQASAILAGRGNKRFLLDVFANIFSALGALSFDDAFDALGQQIDPMHREWVRRYRAEGAEPDPAGQELVLVGWSAREARFVGLAVTLHQGMSAFDVHRMINGHVTPWDDCMGASVMPTTIGEVASLAAAQVGYCRSTSPLTPIGGSLLIAELTQNRMNIQKLPLG